MPTDRLYYRDCYLREFPANVIETSEDGRRVYLDQSAFYPTSGGQLFDLGTINGVPITEVIDEDDRVAHVLESALNAQEVKGQIDWGRRYDFMQQHTGQHLLSAVLEEQFGFATVSVHMGTEMSTVDIDASSVSPQQLEQGEHRCAEIVAQARPVTIGFEDASTAVGLRKQSARSGILRIAEITGIDRSACGGTHVRNTAEIGPVLTGKIDKVRNTTRIEFVCGNRALKRARNDHRLLAALSRAMSAAPENLVEMMRNLQEKNKVLEKELTGVTRELATREGQERYQSTDQDATGIRKATYRGLIDEAVRTRAQAFAANPKAVFLAICDQPPSVLLAASADSGVHAGDLVKAALTRAGGRGGGNATLAQGSLPDQAALYSVIQALS